MVISILLNKIKILSYFFQLSNISRSVKEYWVIYVRCNFLRVNLSSIFGLLFDDLFGFHLWFLLDIVINLLWWLWLFGLWLFWFFYRFLIEIISTTGAGYGFLGSTGFLTSAGGFFSGSAGLVYSLLLRGGGRVSPNSKLSTSFSKFVRPRSAWNPSFILTVTCWTVLLWIYFPLLFIIVVDSDTLSYTHNVFVSWIFYYSNKI